MVIKLNLLPAYINEPRKMIVATIVFVLVLGALAGLLFGVTKGMDEQVAWFKLDSSRCTNFNTAVTNYQAEADKLKQYAAKYTPYLDYFADRKVAKARCEEIVTGLSAAANAIVPPKFPGYFEALTVDPASGTVHGVGKIKGAMNLLNYYFYVRDEQMTVAPQPLPKDATMINLDVTGTVANAKIAEPPSPPAATGTVTNWADMYKAPSAGAASTGAPSGMGGPGGPSTAPTGPAGM